MTNEEQKLREIAYKHAEPKVIWNDGNVSICPDEEKIESLLSDLTALISEWYVSKEEHNKVLQQRDELREALKWVKESITRWCFLGKADAMLKIEAAIKNTDG